MGFSITTRHLPRITGYAHARAHYNLVTPIRGSDNLRPIGKRSAQHLHMVAGTDTRGAYVSFVLYHTDVVRYYADGRILLDLSYGSQSTAVFAQALTPRDVCVWLQGGNCVVHGDHKGVRGTYKTPDKVFLLPTPEGYEIEAIEPVYVRTTDRAAAREVRAKWAPYRKWAKAIAPVLTAGMTADTPFELRNTYGNSALRDTDLELLIESDDEQDWMRVLTCMITARYDWSGGHAVPVYYYNEGPVIKRLEDWAFIGSVYVYKAQTTVPKSKYYSAQYVKAIGARTC